MGHGLAHLQDVVDRTIAFGFKKMKHVGTKKVKEESSKFRRYFRKTAGFLGEMGSSFYEKYEEIKEKRPKK